MADSGCCGRCFQCLAAVPCSALLCWLTTTISVATCGGALMVAARRTKELLDVSEAFVISDIVCLGAIFGMIGLITILLIAATFTSRPLSVDFLISARKTACVKAWLILEILLLLVLLLAWIGVCLASAYPLFVFVSTYVLYYRGEPCIDLKNYLLYSTEMKFCGATLEDLYERSQPTFECFIIAAVGAVLTVLSLVFYLMYTAANYVQIKEAGPTQYSIYKNDVHSGKHPAGSVLDTRM